MGEEEMAKEGIDGLKDSVKMVPWIIPGVGLGASMFSKDANAK